MPLGYGNKIGRMGGGEGRKEWSCCQWLWET